MRGEADCAPTSPWSISTSTANACLCSGSSAPGGRISGLQTTKTQPLTASIDAINPAKRNGSSSSRSADAPATPALTTDLSAPSRPEIAHGDSYARTSQTHPDSPDSAASSLPPHSYLINQSGRGCRTCAESP